MGKLIYFLPYCRRIHNFMFSWWLRITIMRINCTLYSKETIWGDICLKMLYLLISWVRVLFWFGLVWIFLCVNIKFCIYFVYFTVPLTCSFLLGCQLSFFAALSYLVNMVMPPSNFLLLTCSRLESQIGAF